MLRHVRRERIIRVWRAEEGLDGEENGPDLERRRPFVCMGGYRGKSIS